MYLSKKAENTNKQETGKETAGKGGGAERGRDWNTGQKAEPSDQEAAVILPSGLTSSHKEVQRFLTAIIRNTYYFK